MNIIMVSGGVRSGKSAYAEKLALERSVALSAGDAKVLYVATGLRSDGEMNTRIDAHRLRRPETWGTLETADELSAEPYEGYAIILLDTLSAWVGHQLMAIPEERCRDSATTEHIQKQIRIFLTQLRSSKLDTAIIVTDEVGWGGVAMSPLGRWFQDVIGEANQQLASHADEVIAVMSGLPWRLKG